MLRILKNKKRKKIKFSRFIVLGLVGYIGITLTNQQVQIDQKKKKLDELTDQLKIQQMKNDQLRSVVNSNLEGNDDYIKHVARSSLDLSKKGERIFVNISGS